MALGIWYASANLYSEASLVRVLDGRNHTLDDVLAAVDASVAAWPPSQIHRDLANGMHGIEAKMRADHLARAGAR